MEMTRIIKTEVDLPKEAVEVLVNAGFKGLNGNKKFVHYEYNMLEMWKDIWGKLYELDLHFDEETNWVKGQPVISNIINQGYRCPSCGGLDLKPNLPCVNSSSL